MQAKSFKVLYITLKITTKVCDYVTIEDQNKSKYFTIHWNIIYS